MSKFTDLVTKSLSRFQQEDKPILAIYNTYRIQTKNIQQIDEHTVTFELKDVDCNHVTITYYDDNNEGVRFGISLLREATDHLGITRRFRFEYDCRRSWENIDVTIALFLNNICHASSDCNHGGMCVSSVEPLMWGSSPYHVEWANKIVGQETPE